MTVWRYVRVSFRRHLTNEFGHALSSAAFSVAAHARKLQIPCNHQQKPPTHPPAQQNPIMSTRLHSAVPTFKLEFFGSPMLYASSPKPLRTSRSSHFASIVVRTYSKIGESSMYASIAPFLSSNQTFCQRTELRTGITEYF